MQIQFGAIRKATVDSFPNPKGDAGLGRDYYLKQDEFQKAVQAHLDKLAAKHSHQPDYYAVALPYDGSNNRDSSLIIDGAREIKRFLMDVFVEQQRALGEALYLRQQPFNSREEWGNTRQEARNQPAPKALNWGTPSIDLSFLRHNQLDQQAMDIVIQRYSEKAKPLRLKPLDPNTYVVDRTTPEPRSGV